MNINECEKFLDLFINEDGQKPIRQIFKTFETNPEIGFLDVFQSFNHWLSDPRQEVSTATVHGFLLGVLAARVTELPEMHEKFFQKYFEMKARERGENVTGFMDHKIKKGKY